MSCCRARFWYISTIYCKKCVNQHQALPSGVQLTHMVSLSSDTYKKLHPWISVQSNYISIPSTALASNYTPPFHEDSLMYLPSLISLLVFLTSINIKGPGDLTNLLITNTSHFVKPYSATGWYYTHCYWFKWWVVAHSATMLAKPKQFFAIKSIWTVQYTDK